MLLTMESKTAAQHKLETMIQKGRATAGSVIEHVMSNQPKDRLVRSRDLTFIANPESTEITVSFPDGPRVEGAVTQRLHRNALNQMAQATDLPLKFCGCPSEHRGALGAGAPGTQSEYGLS